MMCNDLEAKRLYEKYTDNHPTIHSNRFPPWEELTPEQRDEWRQKATDADNSKLFSQRRVCMDCEEEFNLGEMYPGKRHIDPPECPYCRSPRSKLTG